MKEIIIFVVSVFILSLLLMGLGFLFGNIECNVKAQNMGVPHKYGLVSECMVQQNGLWIPIENWQINR